MIKKQPPEVFCKVLQNSQENTCARVSFLIKLQVSACNFMKKETLAQVFSYEFCQISQNTFFIEHLRTTASATHPEAIVQGCTVKKDALENFAKFTGKHLCWVLFLNKVTGLRSAILLIERLWQTCFPVNFAKLLRRPIL